MNNYNYNFPNSGTNNWGHGLNAILRQMQTDISALQDTVYAGIDKSVESLTFPYASSGIVGNSTSFNVEIKNHEISVDIVNGVFYFGGLKRILRTLTNFKLNTYHLDDQYYYLYLKYDPVDDTVVLEQNYRLLTEWSYILLGVTTPYGDFITKVYSATKTAMQHQDEDTKRSVEIIVDSIDAYDSMLVFGTNAEVTYYGDGVGYSINSTNNDSKTFTLGAGGHNFAASFIDYYDSGLLQTARVGGGKVLSETNVFRVLMAIDGKLYKQHYYLDHPELSYDITSENTIKNFGFFNYVKLDNSNITEGFLQASGYVEICRVLKDSKTGKFYIFKSENNGLWGLPNASLWHGYTGQIATPALQFTGALDGSYPFHFATKQSNKAYVLPKSSSRAATVIDSQTGYQEVDLITSAYAGDKSILWDLQDSQTMNTRIVRTSDGLSSSFTINNTGASLGIADPNNNVLKQGVVVDDSQVNIKSTNSTLTLSDSAMDWNGLVFNRSDKGFSLSPVVSDYELMDFTKFLSLKTSHISIEQGYDLTFVSDRRHKENINTLYNNSLMIVKNTPVVTYNYIGSDAPQIGIISQDLEQSLNDYENKCFIQVVKEDTIPDCKRLKETKLIYILWKALQEETAKREELEIKISKLLGE